MTALSNRLPPLLVLLACLAAGPVHANCTNPAGVERDHIYNNDYHTYQFCNGSQWISEGGAGGTRRSMVTGWPDVILCDMGFGPFAFFANALPFNNDGKYYYRYLNGGGGTNDVLFNSDGTFSNYNNISSSNCNVSISTLYSNGQAFNMVGGP